MKKLTESQKVILQQVGIGIIILVLIFLIDKL